MSGGKIAPWIYKNLEHKSYVGLYWEDDGKYFRVIWQKKGTTGYEKTLEVCRGYVDQHNMSSLDDSSAKSRFLQAIYKSPFVKLVYIEKNLQMNNYLQCDFTDRFKELIESNSLSIDDRSKSSAEMMEIDAEERKFSIMQFEHLSIKDSKKINFRLKRDIAAIRNNCVITRLNRKHWSRGTITTQTKALAEKFRFNWALKDCTSEIVSLKDDMCMLARSWMSSEFSEKAQLNVYKVQLYYDGKEVATVEGMDLTNPHRFHYGNPQEQLENAKEALEHKPQDDRITEFGLTSMAFPQYEGECEKTKSYLENAVCGIALMSNNGCLKAKRLSKNKIYRSESHSGQFSKMKRREEEILVFSYEKFIEDIFKKDPALNDEITFTFGKKPKPGVAAHVRLVVKPLLIPYIRSRFQILNNESCSQSASDSIERMDKVLRSIV